MPLYNDPLDKPLIPGYKPPPLVPGYEPPPLVPGYVPPDFIPHAVHGSSQLSPDLIQQVLDAINGGKRIPTHLTPQGPAVGAVKVKPKKGGRKPASVPPTFTAPPAYGQDGGGAPTSSGLDATTVAALAKSLTASPDYAALAQQAAALAQGDVGAQVGAYRVQQGQLVDEGKSTAATILAAAKAAAGLNPNLPNILKSNYEGAAKLLAGITGNLTGHLSDAELADAAKLGSHLPGDSTGLSPSDTPNKAALALNELHGVIPASGLLQTGLSQFDEAKQLGHLLHGAGTQGALLAQGAKNKEANALGANIANVEAQLPHLTNQYLGQLSSQELDRLRYSAANELALAKLGVSASKDATKAGTIDSGASNVTGFQTDKSGNVRTDSHGYPIPIKGYRSEYKGGQWTASKIKAPSSAKGMTDNDLRSLGKSVASWAIGGTVIRNVNGQPTPYPDPNHPRVAIGTAVTRVMSQTHWSTQQALNFVLSQSERYRREYQNDLARKAYQDSLKV